jgi:hypothetical protein
MMPRRRLTGPGRSLAAVVVAGLMIVATSCLPNADVQAKSGPGNNPGTGYPQALLTNVRTSVHSEEDGFDRIVFDFLNHVPAWDAAYVAKPVVADGSGQPVPLAGDVALQVHLRGATQIFATPAAPQGYIDLYPGPDRIAPALPQVVELVQTGDFEGVLTWSIGTRAQVPFRISMLDTPYRLVLDVAHA